MRLTYIKLIATVFFWGSNFAMGKFAIQSFDPYSAALIRFLVGATILLIVLYRANGAFPSLTVWQWRMVLLSSFTGVFLYNVLFFSGIQHMPTIRASLLVAFSPITVAVASWLIFKERITLIKWIGIMISLVGAITVISRGNFNSFFTGASWGFGEILIFGSVVAWTVYTLLGRVVLTTIQPLTLSAYSAAIGCLLLLIPAWQHGIVGSIPKASWQSWVAVIYMGITATALGYIWFYDAVKKLGAAQTTVVGNLTPVFAVFIAVIFLGESLTISTIIGGILVMIGILLTNGLLRRPHS